MKTAETIKQLTELKDKATDPNVKKEIAEKINVLKNQKDILK